MLPFLLQAYHLQPRGLLHLLHQERLLLIASPTKQQVKAALLRTTKDLRSAAAARDVAIAKNSRLEKKLVSKEITVKKAKADSIKFKAATKKSEREKARLERALLREQNLRHEDAIAAEEALQRERHEFQLYLKSAISEVKASFYFHSCFFSL